MPRQKPADKVEALRRQQAEIAARLKEAEAIEREQRREDERRRVEVAGRVAVALLDQAPETETARLFRVALADRLKRPADRALFPGLDVPAGTAAAPEIPPAET